MDGGFDASEDVAGTIEMALNKKWKSNSRFAILVADAPCHGKKYHNIEIDIYPNGDPLDRNIEKLIEDLAVKNVSLFCMKIKSCTDKMYEIFGSIYNKYKDCQFQVVSMKSNESLPDVVVDSAVKVYIIQRNK